MKLYRELLVGHIVCHMEDHSGRLTYEVAAVQVGVSKSTLWRAARGKPPSRETLEKIATWLAKPIDHFMIEEHGDV